MFNKGSNHRHSNFNGDLYHKDVFMPSSLVKKVRKMFKEFKRNNSITLAKHLIDSVGCDRCHKLDTNKLIEVVNNVNPDTIQVVEIGTEMSLCENRVNDSVLKFMFRTEYDDTNDVVVVLSESGKIKTAWLNYKTDNHQDTLNKNRYIKPFKR